MNQPEPSPRPSKIRVLHVDDETTQLDFTKKFLEMADEGLIVESAVSPEDALRLFKTEAYDCVVSDFMMSPMDGIEVARRIRESSDIPIILYTGRGSEEVAEAAFTVGIDDYIRKEMNPSHYQVLARRIKHAVERYRAEDNLRSREQELSSMIENSVDGIFRVEMARGITRCNSAFLRFFGYSLEELQMMGMGMLELIHDEDKAQFRSSLDDLSSRKLENYTSLNRWYTKSGEVIWLDSNITGLIQDEKFIGVEIIARDVTEQKRAEEEIRGLALFPSENSNPVLRISKDGVILYANAAARPLLGEWGSKIGDAVPDGWAEWVSGAYNSGSIDERESIYRDRVFSFSVVPVVDTDYVNIYGRDITEHKRMEEELKASEEKYRSLLEEGLDGVVVTRNREYLYVNQRYAEMLGYSDPSDLIGRNTSEVIDPKDAEQLDVISERRKRGDVRRFIYELRSLKKDGSSIWLGVASSGIEFEGNQAVITYARDITERKRMEEEIQRSEARLRLFMDTATDYFYLYDSNLNLQDVNNSGMIVFPNTTNKEDVLGKNILEIIPGIDETERPEKYKEVLETGNPVFFDSVKLHPSVGDIEIAIKAFKVGDGLGIHSFNLTEQRVTEKRFETLHSHAAELASATTLAEVGKKTFEAIGKTLEVDIGSFQIIENGMVKPIYSQDIRQRNFISIKVDGPGIVARTVREGTTQLVPDTRSDPDFITGPEAMGREMLSELAVPVIVRDEVVAVINVESVELGAFDSNDQRLVEILAEHVASAIDRIQSQRRLDELRERHTRELVAGVQRISSMVRHDIKGPLQTIMNAAYIANREPEKREEMMGIITGSVKHANDIMEDWKNQDFEETLDITEVDLSQLISDSLAASLIPSSVTVEVNVGSMKVSLDKVKMRRVMDNLIRNALEAMKNDGRLTISAREDDHEIKIEVSDTGIGIPETELGNLFRPFYTTKAMGMGLGLTYSRRAVEAHEGTIDVESKAGEGAKFTISLPKKPEKD
ncbi:MAG: PAS domain S-box protein [Candidatus Thermoplasmatota archaeon]|nr:PAS domain S-box protein [Candidatus Thermoplasmatota archaeon]